MYKNIGMAIKRKKKLVLVILAWVISRSRVRSFLLSNNEKGRAGGPGRILRRREGREYLGFVICDASGKFTSIKYGANPHTAAPIIVTIRRYHFYGARHEVRSGRSTSLSGCSSSACGRDHPHIVEDASELLNLHGGRGRLHEAARAASASPVAAAAGSVSAEM